MLPAVGGGATVEIPKGDPDALAGAASLWAGLADALRAQANVIDSTAGTTSMADWIGPASSAFAGSAALLSGDLGSAADACDRAATACRTFAHALRDAQHRAHKARDDAEEAQRRMKAAQRRLDDANAAAQSARDQATAAATRETHAAAAGPAGEPLAAAARADGHAAATALSTAEGDARHASQALDAASDDLDDAVKRGIDANDDADRAAHHAAGVFGDVAGAAQPPSMVGPPAVPVSVHGEDPLRHISPFSPIDTSFGITPSDIRREQIAADEARRKAEERKRAGDWDDSFGGMASAWTGTDFGIGDPKTTAYKGNKWLNDKLAMVPTPGSIGRHILKEGGEKAIKAEVRHEAVHATSRLLSREDVTRVAARHAVTPERAKVIERALAGDGSLNTSGTVARQTAQGGPRSHIPVQSVLDTIGGGTRVPDPKGIAGHFMYKAPASYGGSQGTLEVLVDERTGQIRHVLFRSGR